MCIFQLGYAVLPPLVKADTAHPGMPQQNQVEAAKRRGCSPAQISPPSHSLVRPWSFLRPGLAHKSGAKASGGERAKRPRRSFFKYPISGNMSDQKNKREAKCIV
jgi:hypothetical protein